MYIAERIKKILHKIIHDDQKGFVQGRFIGEDTCLVSDIIEYAERNAMPVGLLLIDFEKGFDTISWSFLINTLKLFNFWPSVTMDWNFL